MVVLLINLIYNSFIGLSNLDFRVLQFFHLLIQFGCSTIVEDAILLLKSFDSWGVGFVKKKKKKKELNVVTHNLAQCASSFCVIVNRSKLITISITLNWIELCNLR